MSQQVFFNFPSCQFKTVYFYYTLFTKFYPVLYKKRKKEKSTGSTKTLYEVHLNLKHTACLFNVYGEKLTKVSMLITFCPSCLENNLEALTES